MEHNVRLEAALERIWPLQSRRVMGTVISDFAGVDAAMHLRVRAGDRVQILAQEEDPAWLCVRSLDSEAVGSLPAECVVADEEICSGFDGALKSRPGSDAASAATPGIPPRPTIAVTASPQPLMPPRPRIARTATVEEVLVVTKAPAVDGFLVTSHPSYQAIERAWSAVSDSAKPFRHPDYSDPDSHALKTPQSATRDIPTLALHLVSPFSRDPAWIRYRALFKWITENIAYDTSYRQRSPEQALRDRISVCSGYSGLFKALCDQVGLHCELVNGGSVGGDAMPGDGFLDMGGHAWNAVLLDNGETRFIDCTWGAGFVNGSTFTRKFDRHYFLTEPKQFIFTHFPVDAKQQYLDLPLTTQELIRLPRFLSLFFKLGLSLYRIKCDRGGGIDPRVNDLSLLRIGVGELVVIELKARGLYRPVNGSTVAHIGTPLAPVKKNVVWLDGAERRGGIGNGRSGKRLERCSMCHAIEDDDGVWTITFRFRCGEPGTGHLELLLGEVNEPFEHRAEGKSGVMNQCMAFRLDVVEDGHGKDTAHLMMPQTFSHSLQLIEPHISSLQVGQTCEFVVVGDEPGFVISPSFEITQMSRAEKTGKGVQTCSVRINKSGKWSVGSKNGNSYSFAAQFDAA